MAYLIGKHKYIQRISREAPYMNRNALFAFSLAATLFTLPAYGAWGDVSYDPNPTLIDLDEAARYDAVGLLTTALSSSGARVRRETQKFESGFAAGQVLNDWVGIGGNQVRFGFGSSLGSVDWRARIGQIDPLAGYGLTHPHGTYGNAPGVLGDPRNYIADHYFLTSDTAVGTPVPQYFVMQFESPINFLALTLLDYANQIGGLAHLDLYLGDDLATASTVPIFRGSPDRTVGADTLDGAIDYFVARGPYVGSSFPPRSLAPFNIAVLRLDTPDATVGFDNIFVARTVPEPGSIALLLGGLGLLAASRAGRRR
jgi:hypothetical protein